MRIQNHDIKLSVQGRENDKIKDEIVQELSNIFAKMNKKETVPAPVPTENKLIDNLCNTIFIQKKRIKELEGELHGMELAKQINDHIKRVEEDKHK